MWYVVVILKSSPLDICSSNGLVLSGTITVSLAHYESIDSRYNFTILFMDTFLNN